MGSRSSVEHPSKQDMNDGQHVSSSGSEMGSSTSVEQESKQDMNDGLHVSSSGLFPWILTQNLKKAKNESNSDLEASSMGKSAQKLFKRLLYYFYLTIYAQGSFQSFGNYLAQEGTAELLKNYFKIYSTKLNRDGKLNDKDFSDMHTLLRVAVNYSQTSIPLTERMVKCDILEHLLGYLKLFQETFEEEPKTQGIIVLCSVTILYNCSLSNNNSKGFRKLQAAEFIAEFAKDKVNVSINGDKSIAPMCYFILAHIFDLSDEVVDEPGNETIPKSVGDDETSENQPSQTSEKDGTSSDIVPSLNSETQPVQTPKEGETSSKIESTSNRGDEDKQIAIFDKSNENGGSEVAPPSDESDKTKKFEVDDDVITFLLKELDDALGRIDRYSKLGFPAKGLARSLSRLAMNDNNSKKLLKQKLLKKLMKLIKKGWTAEKIRAVECIWALSFVEENKKKINANKPVIEKLNEFMTHKDKKLRTAASGAMWVLKSDPIIYDSNGKAIRDGEREGGDHVMLSYSWNNQPVIKKLKAHLESKGFNVWMDLDQMRGDILQTMAEAVEQSAVVLVALSRSYSESQNCRTEGTYAYQQKKEIIPLMVEKGYRPKGWLGALLGTKLYYNVTDITDLHTQPKAEKTTEVVSSLVKELGDKGRKKAGEKTHPLSPGHAGAVIKHIFYADLDLNQQPVRLWTHREVENWAKAYGLKLSVNKKLNGKTLLFLKSLKSDAKDFFYRYVYEKLKIREPHHLMHFVNALEHLE